MVQPRKKLQAAVVNGSSRPVALVNQHNLIDENTITLQPILKWAGGKRWLVPKLKQLFLDNQNSRLVEPFSGGLAVALGLSPQKALLNDINPHLINLYTQIKNGNNIQQVSEREALINDEVCYYQVREKFNQAILENNYLTKEAAAYFYYLNRTGYNGLCRFNQKGLYNVPFGRYKTINYLREFSEYKKAFKHFEFSQADFESLEIKANDFIYADPPYDVPFTTYSKEGFKWDDQVRLAQWLLRHDGPVVTSNQATPRILELYQDLRFKVEIVQAPRLISCKGKERKPVDEILAYRV